MAEHDLRTYFTLMELKNRMHKNKLVAEAEIADNLFIPEAITSDLLITEANDGDEHVTFQRLYQPAGSEVDYNQGYVTSQAQRKQLSWRSCMVEDGYQMEEKIANRSGNWKEVLDGEELDHVPNLRARWAQRIFHGTGAGKQITGLANMSYYNVLGGAQLFDNANGKTPSVTANKTRIWFIKHSALGFYTFYPQGHKSTGGIYREYMGKFPENYIDPEDSLTKTRWNHMGKIGLAFGTVLANPMAVVCVCNISLTNLSSGSDFEINPTIITNAINYIDVFNSRVKGKLVCYMHSTTRAMLWNLRRDLALNMEYNQALDQRSYDISGIPIKCDDQISIGETKVAA